MRDSENLSGHYVLHLDGQLLLLEIQLLEAARKKKTFNRLHLKLVPVVHRWEGHGATVHSLGGWRRQRDLVVVGTPQCPALVAQHGPSPHIVFTSATRGVASRGHLGGQDARRGAGVGVGVAGVVHHVGVVVLIGTVSPDGDSVVRGTMKTGGVEH